MDTKKLRHKILDLAIHGKLVPQDPNDEPASVLLERISNEKERLIKESKIKRNKQAASSDLSSDDVPFELPEGWCWTTLGEIGTWQAGGTPSRMHKEYYGGNIPWLKTGDLNDNFITYISEYITEDGVSNSSAKINPKGSVLIAMYGATIGKLGILTFPATTNQACCACIDYKGIEQMYLFYYLMYNKEQFIRLGGGGAQPNISKEIIVKTFIPLPPLAEQKRIVSAVEQWMSVVDVLENNEEDLRQSIDKAKSKILDLAIRGKLVPQDSNDEPVSDLLKRLGISPDNSPCEDLPFELPDGWLWQTLESLSTDSSDGPFGSNLKKEHYTLNKEVRIIQLSNIGEEGWREENTKYTTFEHLKTISRSEVHSGDIVIAKMMPAGRAILCPNHEKGFVLSSDAVKFELVNGLDRKYILYAINSFVFREQVYNNVQGVTRVRTSLQKLRRYFIPLPPLAEQHRIVAKIEQLYSQLDEIESSLQS